MRKLITISALLVFAGSTSVQAQTGEYPRCEGFTPGWAWWCTHEKPATASRPNKDDLCKGIDNCPGAKPAPTIENSPAGKLAKFLSWIGGIPGKATVDGIERNTPQTPSIPGESARGAPPIFQGGQAAPPADFLGQQGPQQGQRQSAWDTFLEKLGLREPPSKPSVNPNDPFGTARNNQGAPKPQTPQPPQPQQAAKPAQVASSTPSGASAQIGSPEWQRYMRENASRLTPSAGTQGQGGQNAAPQSPAQPAATSPQTPAQKPASQQPATTSPPMAYPSKEPSAADRLRDLVNAETRKSGVTTFPTSTRAAYTPGQGVQKVALATSYAKPGGILLSKAAAERMALNLELEAVHYGKGTIILAGRKSQESIDAALFLTTLRLACEGVEPYFSLDPPDQSAWSQQSRAAMTAIMEHLKRQYGNGVPGIATFDVAKSYPAMWSQLSAASPELRSELVFRPGWLRYTRVGDILYRADVLLKELSVGFPVVDRNGVWRGEWVAGYTPALRLQARGRSSVEAGHRGFRLWFDLAPLDDQAEVHKASLYASDGSLDISEVRPMMFVRRHENGQDVPGSDPAYDWLAGDVSRRSAEYGEAFEELRQLTHVFRAYVAALKIARENARACPVVGRMPLLDSEKVTQPLPASRPALMFAAIARTGGRTWSQYATVQGGIAMRGRKLHETATVARVTPLMAQLRRDLDAGTPTPMWERDGRQFVALSIEGREPPRKVPIVAQ